MSLWSKRRRAEKASDSPAVGSGDAAAMHRALVPTVYWRPGCPFCGSLFRSLDRLGVHYETRNVWEDPDASAFVRSVARGNETVPTVAVGTRTMVNPQPQDVLSALIL